MSRLSIPLSLAIISMASVSSDSMAKSTPDEKPPESAQVVENAVRRLNISVEGGHINSIPSKRDYAQHLAQVQQRADLVLPATQAVQPSYEDDEQGTAR